MSTGVLNRRIADVPVAVVDLETTGLTPGFDRVVEVSVVRIDPGQAPRLVFDTLVNPMRAVAGTEIHGITDEHVATAPRFNEIAAGFLKATQGCAITAYNVYFDIKFLTFELKHAGIHHDPPHFCLMYLRPMLGLGSRCKLEEACRLHNVTYAASHVAANDALAAGQLFVTYLTQLSRLGIGTFEDLAARKSYKFNRSFTCSPFPDASSLGLPPNGRLLSRVGFAIPVDPMRQALASYWDALKAVLSDLEVSDDELAYMQREQQQSGLQVEQIRVLHARAFAGAIAQFTSDQSLDDKNAESLRDSTAVFLGSAGLRASKH